MVTDSEETTIHPFPRPVTETEIPDRFTDPFHYTPHPLCREAAAQVQAYLAAQASWQAELRQGKMFGVLVVRAPGGAVGYLAAYSGVLAGSHSHPFFVPPVYDLLQPQGFFKEEESRISALNRQIDVLQNAPGYVCLCRRLAEETARMHAALARAKAEQKAAKERRDACRQRDALTEAEHAALIRESQFQKAQRKRLACAWSGRLASLQTQADAVARQIEDLKAERKTRSAALQQRLFAQFRLLNARGETKDLCALFAETAQRIPPAGAGECAAPRLLQYAYLHRLQPVAMAEFWWGDSPRAEIRRHGQYYPACRGKCGPILAHMLQGLDVARVPWEETPPREVEIVYEDEWLLVVNKPAGMLSVPGKSDAASVYSLVRQNYPEAENPLMPVHRLDMATSGLLLLAKTKEAHRRLQAQFADRTIRKRYVAWLDGVVSPSEGFIRLPLRPDPLDRPRQVVDFENGKPAVTRYRVLKRVGDRTLVAFFPLTGRTHQLRVHAAHPRGLNCPIRGDGLYGSPGDRLYLHAEYLEFTHPFTGTRLRIEKPADFPDAADSVE